MARSDLDICLRAHQRARRRLRLDFIYGYIVAREANAKASRIDAAFDKRWNKVVGLRTVERFVPGVSRLKRVAA